MSADQAIKQPCRVATTGNITLSGLSTIDDVALSAGDRVLVRAQTSAADNGIYDAASGSWTRSTDFDGAGEVVGGTQVLVTSGTVNTGRAFRVGGAGAITINSSPVNFEAATGAVSVMDFIPAADHAAILGFSGGAPNVTTYVEAAQDALVARGGGMLDFPAGLFKISGFELASNVNLRGVNAGGQYGLLWATSADVGTIFVADGGEWIVHQDTDKTCGSIIGIDFLGNGAGEGEGGALMEGYRFAVGDCSFYRFANQGLKFGGTGGRVTNIGVFDCVKDRAREALTGALEGVGQDCFVAFVEIAGGTVRSDGVNGIVNTCDMGDFTAEHRISGSIQLTGASTTTGFQEGDRITGPGIQAGTEIAAIGGGTIYLNLPATSSGDDATYTVTRHHLWFCAYLDGGSNTENSHIVAGLAERGIHSLTYTNRYTACRADRNFGPGWSGTFAADASCIAFDNSQGGIGIYDGFDISLPVARLDGCQASSSGVALYGDVPYYHRYGCNVALGAGAGSDGLRPIVNDFRSCLHIVAPMHDHIYAISGLSSVRGTNRGTGTSIDFANIDCYHPDDGSPVTITAATNLVVGQVYKIFGNANVTLQHGTYFELNGGANLTLAARKVYAFVAALDFLGTNYLAQV